MVFLMRFVSIQLAVLVASILLSHAANAAGWRIVFEDTFNGKALDRQKWATRYIYNNETQDRLNDEVERYRDNGNHIVQDGELQLIAKPVGPGQYESGMIRSQQTFYYGYFEARVFLPKGRGIWPAFWLNSDYDKNGKLNWPPEIDIFEYVVNGKEDLDTMVHSAIIPPPSNPPTFEYRDPKFDPRWLSYVADRPLNDSWHVFGLVWTPDKVSVFLDGKRLYTRAYRWVRKDGSFGPPAHLLLNFAIGGQWAGRHGIDEANFPQAFKIDYVRVCQFAKGDEGKRYCGNSQATPDPAVFGYQAEFDDMPKPLLAPRLLPIHSLPADGQLKRVAGSSTTLRIGNRLELPPTEADVQSQIVLILKNKQTGREAFRSIQQLDQGAIPERKDIEIVIPPSVPAGEYSLHAAIFARINAQGKPPQNLATPVKCESIPKALSCQIGRIELSQ